MLEDVVRVDVDMHNLRQLRAEQRTLQLQLERIGRHRQDDSSPDRDNRNGDDQKRKEAQEQAQLSSDGKWHVVDLILE